MEAVGAAIHAEKDIEQGTGTAVIMTIDEGSKVAWFVEVNLCQLNAKCTLRALFLNGENAIAAIGRLGKRRPRAVALLQNRNSISWRPD